MSGWLSGKVALLIGAGSGIGRAVLDAYVAEGATVVAFERDPGKCEELSRLGEDVLAFQGDATSSADNRRAVELAVERFGRLDTLATFVGVFDHYTALLDIPDESFDAAFVEMFDLNLRSVMLAARAAGPALRAARGSIVVTASSSSFAAGRGGSLYVASKFAVRGLILQLAREFAPDVRVNGVAPGGTVGTDLRGLRALGLAADRLDDRPGRAEGIEKRTPLALAMSGEHHAGLYVLLASTRSSAMTGEVLRSDGGMAVA